MNTPASKVRSRPAVRCALNPERMFPVDESGPGQRPTAGERAALAVCAACPVRAACRAAVLEMPLAYGVAGGLTAAQRRELRAVRLDRRTAA
jgi:Transcription factor WhiB.